MMCTHIIRGVHFPGNVLRVRAGVCNALVASSDEEVVQCVARAQASPGGAPGLELELQSVLLPPLSAALLRVELLP